MAIIAEHATFQVVTNRILTLIKPPEQRAGFMMAMCHGDGEVSPSS
jgi:hypothetical protein